MDDAPGPHGRWNDDRLDDLASQMRMMAPLVTTVATHGAHIDGLREDIADLKQAHHKEAAAAAAFRCAYRQDREHDLEARAEQTGDRRKAILSAVTVIAAAAVGAVATVIAAMIAVGAAG